MSRHRRRLRWREAVACHSLDTATVASSRRRYRYRLVAGPQWIIAVEVMTIKAQTPLVLVEQFYSDGKRLVEITSVGDEYVTASDVISELEVVVPLRDVGKSWFRIYPERTT